MVSMIVLTCIIWIEGSPHSGGETMCGMHEAEIKYYSIDGCKANIPAYEKFVVKSIYDAFEMPSDYTIQTQCFKDFGSKK